MQCSNSVGLTHPFFLPSSLFKGPKVSHHRFQSPLQSFPSKYPHPFFSNPTFPLRSSIHPLERAHHFPLHKNMTKHRLTKNRRSCWLWPCGCLLLLVLTALNRPEAVLARIKTTVDICDYFRAIGKLETRPECQEGGAGQPIPTGTTPRISASSEEKLPSCSAHAHLVQCTAESEECPGSGQLCTQSDASQCCQEALQGIPVSHINSKPGNCPQPVGISLLQDGSTGCWLDTNCPGIQKCCLEPSPIQHTARRICRDPNGISSDSICTLPLIVGSCTAFVTRYYFDQSTGKCKPFQYSGCGGNANNFQSLQSCHSTCGLLGVKGTPSCPSEANAELNCLLPHADACHTDSDCMGREGGQQPSCCMTKCGYRICYIY